MSRDSVLPVLWCVGVLGVGSEVFRSDYPDMSCTVVGFSSDGSEVMLSGAVVFVVPASSITVRPAGS